MDEGLHILDHIEKGQLPQECIDECGSGEPWPTSRWQRRLKLTVDRQAAQACLGQYRSWTPEELNDASDEDLAGAILWLACNAFRSGKDVFVLRGAR